MNRPDIAKTASTAALILGLVISFFTSGFLIFVRNSWGSVWTDDEVVIELVADILPIAAVYQLSDALAGNSPLNNLVIAGGVLRGVGKQRYGAVFNLIGYYLIAVPISLLLAFVFKLGVVGLFAGLVGGIAFVSAGQILFIYFRINWIHETKACKLRGEEVSVSVEGSIALPIDNEEE
jgi:MATE family multidrug resistance protein